MAAPWRKCSSCKQDILLGAAYYVCSVSTCQSKVTNYAFCTVPCWDAHLPVERHRSGSAGAIERRAPATLEPARKVIVSSDSRAAAASSDDVLVVVSKVRKYINDRSSFNTSASAYDALTEKIKSLCDRAIDAARADGRKTVMDKDFS
jgi:histone H3/H4